MIGSYSKTLFVWLVITSCLLIANTHGKVKKPNGKPKNIVFIVADDLGWADIGYGDKQVISPNIDALARNGIVLNQSYAYSLCTPTRNSILSGVYAEKTGLQHSVILPESPIGLPTSFTLFPEVLKQFGYQSHMVGKWHLGFCNKMYSPVDRGFDTFYGYFNAQEDHYTHRLSANIIFGNSDGLDYWNQTKDYLEPILDKNNTYSMYTFTERALDILDKQDKSKPFFLYFSSQNCHAPNQVPQVYQDMYAHIKDADRRTFLGMVTALDDAVGNITKKLRDLDLLDDTIIAFTSDNGGATYASGRNYPLRGGKMTIFEGGHRVRAFINAADLKPYTNEGMFHAVDWLPTLLNGALGVPVEVTGIDGINQWPSLTQNLPSNRTSFIYNVDPFGQIGCAYKPTEGIREGDFKYIKGCPGIYNDWYPLPTYDKEFVNNYYDKFSPYRKSRDAKFDPKKYDFNSEKADKSYLFNIKNDPTERHNLVSQYPEIVASMEAKLKEYKKTFVFPQNPPSLLPSPEADPAKWGDKWTPGWC